MYTLYQHKIILKNPCIFPYKIKFLDYVSTTFTVADCMWFYDTLTVEDERTTGQTGRNDQLEYEQKLLVLLKSYIFEWHLKTIMNKHATDSR